MKTEYAILTYHHWRKTAILKSLGLTLSTDRDADPEGHIWTRESFNFNVESVCNPIALDALVKSVGERLDVRFMPRSEPPIFAFFTYAHLPEHLAVISMPFCRLAYQLYDELTMDGIPFNDELEHCFRKLLEAKDCAVRAAVPKT